MGKKYTKKDLEAVAVEFNNLLQDDSQISVGDETAVERLEKDLKDVATNVLTPEDNVSESAIKLMKMMKLELPQKEQKDDLLCNYPKAEDPEAEEENQEVVTHETNTKESETETTTESVARPKATGNIPLMMKMIKEKKTDDEIKKEFTDRYKTKDVTDEAFIAKRITAYANIAKKELAKESS